MMMAFKGGVLRELMMRVGRFEGEEYTSDFGGGELLSPAAVYGADRVNCDRYCPASILFLQVYQDINVAVPTGASVVEEFKGGR